VNRPEELLRLNRDEASGKPSVTSHHLRRHVVALASRRQGPKLVSWTTDPKKPFATLDGEGKHIVWSPARLPRRRTISSQMSSDSSHPASPLKGFSQLASPVTGHERAPTMDYYRRSSDPMHGPMLGGPTDLTISDLVRADPALKSVICRQVIGPPEAFFPFTSINADGSIEMDDDRSDDDDVDEAESMLKWSDFIEDGYESCYGQEDGDEIDAIMGDEMAHVSPKELGTPHSLLQHLDRGGVTSFRRNQQRHQSFLRGLSCNLSLYGIKYGRQTFADNPITPPRRPTAGDCERGDQAVVQATIGFKRRVISLSNEGRRKRRKNTI
jgi:hypothetical protein